MSRTLVVLAVLFGTSYASLVFAQASSDVEKVEPAQGQYVLQEDSPAYRGPNAESGELRQVHAGKKIVVTGATRDFAQVTLKDGAVGYVRLFAIALLRPADNNFILSSDTPVYAGPHLANSTVATVHRGSYVHVVGVELYYLKIRLDNGTEGFIPVAAVRERVASDAR